MKGRQTELEELDDDDAPTFGNWEPYVRRARMTPITIALPADMLAKLRELVAQGGKFYDKRPDGGGYRGCQRYADVIRWACSDFLKKHAPEKKETASKKKAAKRRPKAKKRGRR